MTELSIYIPSEIAVRAEHLVQEAQIPLLPAGKVGSGVFHPDRIPQIPGDRITSAIPEAAIPLSVVVEDDIPAIIGAHEAEVDPHNQYEKKDNLGSAAYADTDDFAGAFHDHNEFLKPFNDPAPPAVNERRHDTADGMIWFWNGTYWLSEQIFVSIVFSTTLTVLAGFGLMGSPAGDYDIYIISFSASGGLSSPQNAADYWRVQLERVNSANNAIGILTHELNTYSLAAGTIGMRAVMQPNLHQDVSALGTLYYRVVAYRQASAGSFSQPSFVIRYRLAKP